MCGIFAVFPKKAESVSKCAPDVRASFATLKHRGPDTNSLIITNDFILGFHRLSINDLSDAGNQPFEVNQTRTVCNGEIYNWVELCDSHDVLTTSHSDCEVLAHLVDRFGRDFDFNSIDGVFACAHARYNEETKEYDYIVSRDPIGVRPLFYLETDDYIAFASEAKALVGLSSTENVHIFPIGTTWYNGTFKKYHMLPVEVKPANRYSIYHGLVQAVEKRIHNCDTELGFFLSGGLDSSLVAAIAKTLKKKRLKTFSIGMDKESPDLVHARKMAQALGSEHHEVIYTKEEGISTIPFIIHTLESFDCTTVRASIPMYLLCKYIKENTNVKVMLSGEGADELFGGYLYFHNAPTPSDFQLETKKLVKNVHMFDGLRADRCTAAWGLEVRVPFFDRNFVDLIVSIPPEAKMPVNGIEKHILRKAFQETPVKVPYDILWRQKNAFSDAVGYGWIDAIKEHVENKISDKDFAEHRAKYPTSPPMSKEELFYRTTFDNIFPHHEQLGAMFMWRPNWTHVIDPSATFLDVHEDTRAGITQVS